MSAEVEKDREARLRELGVDTLVEPRDAEYMLMEDLPQETVVCTITTYRHPDRLVVGDPAPDVELHGLETGSSPLPALVRNRPLVLFFGSYT